MLTFYGGWREMSLRINLALVASILLFSFSEAQNRTPHPPVSAIFLQFDVDQNGVLNLKEVESSRYARQFVRWDADSDDSVNAEDIIRFRKRFGIAADGSMIQKESTFIVPDPEDLPMVDRSHPPSRAAARESAYRLKTREHSVSGVQYKIITDHSQKNYLKALERLAEHHHGEVIRINSLRELSPDKTSEKLQTQLRGAKFVAIAPRIESFTEGMLLDVWALLCGIDEDSLMDVWPGLLIASDAQAFEKLIDQSIEQVDLAGDEIRPLAISQVRNRQETRSLQKAGVLRKVFEERGIDLPVISIYGNDSEGAPQLRGPKTWNLKMPAAGKFVSQFPEPVEKEMNAANLWIMHGHGIPGMSCSMDIQGLPDAMDGKILLSGSCFSAFPWNSDLPSMGTAPGGYQMKQADSFVIRAVDRGAILAFGHQRLNSGFPHLYPVFEALLEGKTAGQAYQELLNGLIEYRDMNPADFALSESDKKSKRPPQNSLLYVMIGDPAFRFTDSE